jgi:hypothetical protein
MKRKIYIIAAIALVVIMVSTINVYLVNMTSPNIGAKLLTLSNRGLALSQTSTIPSGGCIQNTYTNYENQNGYWYKKTVTLSCLSNSVIRYCEVGTKIYHCTLNCILNLQYVEWSPYSTNISGQVCT